MPASPSRSTDLIRSWRATTKVLITIEEGSVGGFGSHVLQFLATEGLLDGGLRGAARTWAACPRRARPEGFDTAQRRKPCYMPPDIFMDQAPFPESRKAMQGPQDAPGAPTADNGLQVTQAPQASEDKAPEQAAPSDERRRKGSFLFF
jgi:hypothetical protein